jgi:hypothetical protein
MPVEVLTDLAPALLFFVPASGKAIEQALRRDKSFSIEEIHPFLSQVIPLMKREREQRLQAAAAELGGIRGDGPLMKLAHRAPFDLIGMFDQAASTG